jgi:hypothetical protein
MNLRWGRGWEARGRMSWLNAILSLLSAGCAARAACLWLQASLIDPLDDPLLAPSSPLSGAAEPMSCFVASRLFLTRALQRVFRLRLRGRSDEPTAAEPLESFLGADGYLLGPCHPCGSQKVRVAERESGRMGGRSCSLVGGRRLGDALHLSDLGKSPKNRPLRAFLSAC